MNTQIELGQALHDAGRPQRRSLRRQRVVSAREERRATKAYRRWKRAQEAKP